MKARFVTLYIDAAERTAEVRIRRTNDATLGSRAYHVRDGEPSAARLGRLLAGRKHTRYPAQGGWGVTADNGRAHSVYVFGGVNG